MYNVQWCGQIEGRCVYGSQQNTAIGQIVITPGEALLFLIITTSPQKPGIIAVHIK